ncbi:TIGR02757 family protein [Limisalsivibrio acetivorans]|uniref:TIGR02757 family protein n=1 Tax=Limisalsivibrio acetivorans TaxID=1304888 RepID=UPI0003B38D35|nr:TIGR02757 family protein [Limisalsivibrio acetivorans]
MLKKAELHRPFFEELYSRYNRKEYIDTDPIFYPHTIGGSTEFVSLAASCFAYGNVKAIKGFLLSYFNEYGTDPGDIQDKPTELYYRFQKPEDVRAFSLAVRELYQRFGSVEDAFYSFSSDPEEALITFVNHMKGEGERFGAGRGYAFLFPDPVKSGAKRFRMFMRWMIRSDEIDFGLWKKFQSAGLQFPIDTHILRFAYNRGIIKTTAGTRKNLETVTNFFREMNPEDPAKYDFSLTRLGIAGGCRYEKGETCSDCDIFGVCPF